jgi:hypothetical protein
MRGLGADGSPKGTRRVLTHTVRVIAHEEKVEHVGGCQ